MPTNKEIEITLTLKDEATKKIQSFRSGVKEFSKETKDSLAPILQLRRSWMYTSIAIGATVGTILKGAQEIAKLREEIIKLDVSAIKLGISSEQLSKRLYGFNIASIEARQGSSLIASMLESLKNAQLWVTTKAAELIGETTIAAKAYEISKRNKNQGILGNIADLTTSLNPLLFLPKVISRGQGSAGYRDEAIKELEKQYSGLKEKKALETGLVAETILKTKQLELSAFDYKDQLLKEEIAQYRGACVDEINLTKYELAATKRMQDDYNLEAKNQEAAILEAKGSTLDALTLKQENALALYKRQWGSNGDAVQAFKQGQEAVRKQAELTYYGLSSNWQIMHNAFTGYVSSMTNTFSTVFYDIVTGEIDSLGDAFNNFGKEIVKILTDMLAQYVTAKAVMGIVSIAGAFGGGTNSLAPGSYNIGGQSLQASTHTGFGLGGNYVGMAEGGVGIVKKPTLFLAGESGAEEYKFTPLNKRNQGNNGGGETHIHIHNNPTFKVWDMADIYAHKREIIAILGESARLHGDIIKSLRKYNKG